MLCSIFFSFFYTITGREGNQTSRTHIQVLEPFLISALDIQANYLIFNLGTTLPPITAIARAARRAWRKLIFLWRLVLFSDLLTDKEMHKSFDSGLSPKWDKSFEPGVIQRLQISTFLTTYCLIGTFKRKLATQKQSRLDEFTCWVPP